MKSTSSDSGRMNYCSKRRRTSAMGGETCSQQREGERDARGTAAAAAGRRGKRRAGRYKNNGLRNWISRKEQGVWGKKNHRSTDNLEKKERTVEEQDLFMKGIRR